MYMATWVEVGFSFILLIYLFLLFLYQKLYILLIYYILSLIGWVLFLCYPDDGDDDDGFFHSIFIMSMVKNGAEY